MIGRILKRAYRIVIHQRQQVPSNSGAYLSYLRSRGCRIGSNVRIIGCSGIDDNHCWHITLGNNVTIAPGAYILAHDASTKSLTGYTWISPVVVEDDVFIGAHAVVLPGSRLGKGSIIAAGAVVKGFVRPGVVVAGVPAEVIGLTDDYRAKHISRLASSPIFDSSFTIELGASVEKRLMMAERIRDAGGGYVE